MSENSAMFVRAVYRTAGETDISFAQSKHFDLDLAKWLAFEIATSWN